MILAANPKNTSRLELEKEIREIDEGLRRSNKREQFKPEMKLAVGQREFYRAILDTQPQIVHFCGHGAGEDGIVLEDETGMTAFVEADTLASQFKLFVKKGGECVSRLALKIVIRTGSRQSAVGSRGKSLITIYTLLHSCIYFCRITYPIHECLFRHSVGC